MLKGKNINLRLIKEKDLPELEGLYNDIENRGEYYYMGMEPESMLKKKYGETGYWSDDFGRMLIVDKKDKMLGYINYFKSVPYFHSLEIGYRLFYKELHGKGIMTEAVALFVGYLFRCKDINRLELRTHPDNIGSQRVAVKSGFTEEGRARGAILYKDKYSDMCQFSLTRQDYYKSGHQT